MKKEEQIIRLLKDMLKDTGWTEEEIDKYINARIC